MKRLEPPVTIRTRRGPLTVARDGTIEGLWALCRRELLTATEARKVCRCKTRATFLQWRAKDFPAPVLSFPSRGGPLELWSRTEVKAWARVRKAKLDKRTALPGLSDAERDALRSQLVDGTPLL